MRQDEPREKVEQPPRRRRSFSTSDMNGLFFVVAALSATILMASLSEARFQAEERIAAAKATEEKARIQMAHCPFSTLRAASRTSTN